MDHKVYVVRCTTRWRRFKSKLIESISVSDERRETVRQRVVGLKRALKTALITKNDITANIPTTRGNKWQSIE